MGEMMTATGRRLQGAAASNELDARLVCSLLGVEPWRMCRAGGNPSLVLDLFLNDMDEHDTANAFVNGITEMIGAAARQEKFGNVETFAAFIEGRVAVLSSKKRALWVSQITANYAALCKPLGLPPNHPDLITVMRLISAMVDRAYGGSWLDLKYTAAVEKIWFAVCDAALAVEG